MPFRQILVTTDFSDTAMRALDYCRALARATGGTLHVLHVVDGVFVGPFVADPAHAEDAARRALDRCLTDEDRTVLMARTVIGRGHDPARAAVAYARTSGIDCIVVGTHG